MARTIKKRVKEAFPEGSSVEAKEFADKVLGAWKDVATSLRKMAILFFVLMAVFELLAYQPSSRSFTVGSFSFANTSVVRIALPAIAAYAIYDGFQLTLRWIELETAYYALMAIYAPRVPENDLELLIKPPLPSLWGIGWVGSDENQADRFLSSVKTIFVVVFIFFIPLTFEAQAYYILFGQYGYQNVLVWLSAIFSTAAIVITFTAVALSPSPEA
jgi:hypothetical protein